MKQFSSITSTKISSIRLVSSKQQLTCGFMLLGLEQQSSAKSKASQQLGLDQRL